MEHSCIEREVTYSHCLLHAHCAAGRRLQPSAQPVCRPLFVMHVITTTTLTPPSPRRIIAISQVPGACLKFAQLHRDTLVEQKLVHWYLIHLARLQELGIITGTCILQVADLLHKGEVPTARGP